MAVSYSCKAKLHSAVRVLTHTHTHARWNTHTHTHSCTLLERHIRAQMNTVSTHLSFREREKIEKPLVLFLEWGQINRRRLKKTLKLMRNHRLIMQMIISIFCLNHQNDFIMNWMHPDQVSDYHSHWNRLYGIEGLKAIMVTLKEGLYYRQRCAFIQAITVYSV